MMNELDEYQICILERYKRYTSCWSLTGKTDGSSLKWNKEKRVRKENNNIWVPLMHNSSSEKCDPYIIIR